jgi:hypothetical protein
MQYLVGLILCVAVAVFATATGLDRERGFYPPLLIVIASYYVLFAVMGASRRTLGCRIGGPGFCLAFDVIFGVWVAVRLKRVPSLSFKSHTG